MTDILMRPFVALQVAVFELRRARGWPDDDRVRDSARLPRNRHHHRAVLPQDRPPQPVLGRRTAASRTRRADRKRRKCRPSEALTASAESVRRPGYPLDRAGAYVFLERALELPHSGEGHRSRKQRNSPIAHEKAPCAPATSPIPLAAIPARAGRRWSSSPSSSSRSCFSSRGSSSSASR